MAFGSSASTSRTPTTALARRQRSPSQPKQSEVTTANSERNAESHPARLTGPPNLLRWNYERHDLLRRAVEFGCPGLIRDLRLSRWQHHVRHRMTPNNFVIGRASERVDPDA